MLVIYIILSVLTALNLVKETEDKEKSIKKINIYLVIKLFLNLIFANVYIFLLIQFLHKKEWYMIMLPAIFSFIFSVVDSMALYKTIKKLRNLNCTKKDYYFQVIGDNILLYMAWFATNLLHVFNVEEQGDYLFLLFCFVFFIIVNLVVIRIRKFVMKCKEVSSEKLLSIINKYSVEGYKIYEYDGKMMKSANAMVDSMFGRGNIYFSDYLIENMTEDEIEAIYLHEMGHIKKHHIALRNLFLMLFIPLMYGIGVLMDKIEQVQHINIPLGIVFLISIVIGYTVFLYLYISRKQEYAADQYAAENIENIDVLSGALRKLNELNDILESDKGKGLLKSHPAVEKRIERINMIKENVNNREMV